MHNKYLDHLFALAFQLHAEVFRKSHVSLSVRQIRISQRSYDAVCVCVCVCVCECSLCECMCIDVWEDGMLMVPKPMLWKPLQNCCFIFMAG